MTLEEEERLNKEHLERQASFTLEDKLRIFNVRSFLTKEEVIADIEIEIKQVEELIEVAVGDQLQYQNAKKEFLQRFIRLIRKTVLFEKLEPWWAYQYTFSSRGASLELIHVDYRKLVVRPEAEDDYFCVPDTIFTVVRLDAKTMSIDEYAQYISKTEASIRQALRRGKYRSAFKLGQEWRISELCQPNTERGYSRGSYEWHTTLSGVPEGFEYIKEPGFVDIDQDSDDKQSFTIYIHHWQGRDGHLYYLDKVSVERLERFLIANPMVIFTNDEKICNKRRKKNE